MNQMLHVVLRKSRSEGHALVLLMKELDSTVQFCQPTQSLVLAMDGPPSAAKLATQRKRRLATVLKSEYKSKQIRKIIETLQGRTSRTALQKLRKWRRKERRNQADVRTLAITPSTAFMQRAEAALLYWAWQRLTARSNKLCENNVRIFVSNSLHAGEGEVKLIEWVLSKPRKGESIAILGGDSDLVLESLLIPVASTHNAFVLLQDGAKRYLSVSLWETTRALRRIFGIDRIADILYIRTDLVLLLMLNGNDYLPKLRGSSGFNRLFHWYLKLQREWRKQGKKEAYLVDPDTLNFNIDFCLEFFGKLAALQPTNLWSAKTARKITDQSTPLQQLHNLVEGEFLPSPIEFVVIREGSNEDQEYVSVNAHDGEDDNAVSSDDDEEEEEEDILDDCTDEDDDPSDTDDQILVRLSLGHPGSEDFLTYEIWHPKGASFRSARQRLAGVALTDMMDEQSDSEEDEDNEFGFVSPRYDWEITVAEGDCDSFLYGLLWTIQTYLTGVCPDYSYNYGKRMSPTAREITDVFERAKAENRSIGPKDLRSAPSTSSVPAGLSCLAALPSNIKHLVPDPYKFLDDEVIEDFYGRCVDLKTNVFDIKRFERLCEVQLREMGHNVDGSDNPFDDQYWTLLHMVPKSLTKPMTPPEPFSDRLDKLKKHPRMRMTKIEAKRESLLSSPRTEGDTLHSDPGLFLSRVEHIDRVDYRVVYQANNRKIRKGSRTDKKLTNRANSSNSNTATKAASPKIERKVDTPGDKGPQMKEFNVQELPAAIPRNTEGLSALSVLNCLSDSKEIGTVEVRGNLTHSLRVSRKAPHDFRFGGHLLLPVC